MYEYTIYMDCIQYFFLLSAKYLSIQKRRYLERMFGLIGVGRIGVGSDYDG